jgi:hypothetical protein
MSWTNWKGLFAASALGTGLTVAVGGCSSSSGGGLEPADASSEATHPVATHKDAGPDTGATGDDGATTAPGFDGTTGRLCTANADCVGTGANAAMLNQCSSAGYFINGNAIDPTPVCLSTAACDLGDGTTLMFCDSADPTDPTSPGICLSAGQGTTGLSGQCYPKCTVLSDGSAPLGCQGKDVCNVVITGVSTGGQPLALGVCFGGCTLDSDCPAGNVCQKDEGICLTTLKTATKQLGQTCSVNDITGGRYGCNCLTNPTSMLGYCSQFCIVGASSTAPCPSGYICDSGLANQVMNASGATITGFTEQNDGLAGVCFQACGGSVDAGADSGQAGACGATSTCISGTAGSDCLP